MRVEENEGGGTTVIVDAGDRLDDVPETHVGLISQEIEAACSDPRTYFREIADRCPFREMHRWILECLRAEWQLELNLGWDESAFCGFHWNSDVVRPALFELPNNRDLSPFPSPLQEYWSLVDRLHWNGFGCAGGLSGSAGEWYGPETTHPSLLEFGEEWTGVELDPEEAYVWGNSPCGDLVVFLNDGRGGWAEHGAHQIHLLGTIEDTIEHIFSKLNARETPEWEQAWYS